MTLEEAIANDHEVQSLSARALELERELAGIEERTKAREKEVERLWWKSRLGDMMMNSGE